MISQRARDGFDHMLKRAIKGAFQTPSGGACEVDVLDDIKGVKESRVAVLTVSSYLFRVMTLIYFTLDQPTRQYFAGINRTEPDEMDENAFLDVIGECGNICCGALNRDLAQHFPHLGMSTPNMLDRHCVDYLQTLDAGYIKHFTITVDDALTMHASVCVCDYTDLDFEVDMSEAEESNGELEMF